MPNYKRYYLPGGTYFFTVVTYKRKAIFTNQSTINLLKKSFDHTKSRLPFQTIALVILPDHIHCLWGLPENDSDFSKRWQYIKTHFSRHYRNYLDLNANYKVWQNRFWEHCIKNENDFIKHMDYIHYNPVKHGYVQAAAEWPYSTFKKMCQLGYYEPGWGESPSKEFKKIGF